MRDTRFAPCRTSCLVKQFLLSIFVVTISGVASAAPKSVSFAIASSQEVYEYTEVTALVESPDVRYIPALSVDEKVLSMFDLQTQKWIQLMTGTISWLKWSKDGKYLIVYDGKPTSTSAGVRQVRLSDQKVEQIVDLKNFATTGHYGYSLTVAPDDSPLLLRDAGTYDVYSLD